ncbi:MAG: diguanylate cyclase [Spirochaetes bacterium]|nr:diguanylate cyclase [Spirochaetota bacterium]
MKKILIVDDTPANITILGDLLKDKYEIIVATEGESAIEIARNALPDLILLDIMMPGIDGYSVCRTLKQIEETSHIPIVFITARNDTNSIVEGFEAGGIDYIAKPFNPLELNARIKNQMELLKAREQLETYAESLELVSQRLLKKSLELNESVRTDYLTGLATRLHIMEKINEEVNRANRSKSTFAVIIADIDHFKKINDTFGHKCGDIVLSNLAKILKEAIRAQDVLARWGGEEFMFLLPETGEEGAAKLAEKIRSIVESTSIDYSENKIEITMTFGISEYDTLTGVDSMINRADAALYRGKELGRNRVVTYSSIMSGK